MAARRVGLATVLGVVHPLELLIAEDEIKILIQLLILSPPDRALLEFLETIHPP